MKEKERRDKRNAGQRNQRRGEIRGMLGRGEGKGEKRLKVAVIGFSRLEDRRRLVLHAMIRGTQDYLKEMRSRGFKSRRLHIPSRTLGHVFRFRRFLSPLQRLSAKEN
ncbi:hypothetical protein RRG08_054746 [Elysia crispata]|uniref:Uncharacterized protein n=1 Tax=Elysia crispata TaxID=231223 RepID=A0AAE1E7Y9_9GAST|nr:hypothetical protein RRG08_054746 [Elysia crispata]